MLISLAYSCSVGTHKNNSSADAQANRIFITVFGQKKFLVYNATIIIRELRNAHRKNCITIISRFISILFVKCYTLHGYYIDLFTKNFEVIFD